MRKGGKTGKKKTKRKEKERLLRKQNGGYATTNTATTSTSSSMFTTRALDMLHARVCMCTRHAAIVAVAAAAVVAGAALRPHVLLETALLCHCLELVLRILRTEVRLAGNYVHQRLVHITCHVLCITAIEAGQGAREGGGGGREGGKQFERMLLKRASDGMVLHAVP